MGAPLGDGGLTVVHVGPWSTALGLGALFGLAVALALLLQPGGARRNGWMAALLTVMAGRLMPYVLGYAGFYDAYPWLTFAPWDIGLAFGPLLWLHVQARTRTRLPAGCAWHLLPAALQAAYLSLCFAQPLDWKHSWNDRVHAPYIDPALTLLTLASQGVYLGLAARRHAAYGRWLQAHVTNAEEHRFASLRASLGALAVLVLLNAGFELATLGWRLDYYQRFGLYLGLTAVVFVLGLEAWRQAGQRHPREPDADADADPEPDPEPASSGKPEPGAAGRGLDGAAAAPPVPRAAPDWAALGQRWRAITRDQGWWRDPDLSLERLARLLGTNTHYLSRAFNEGLGQGFSTVIGGLRVEAVQAALREPGAPDLLRLALDAGFSSKTSFNRVFKAHTGQTPSAWRAGAKS